jgi:hypothetical protein
MVIRCPQPKSSRPQSPSARGGRGGDPDIEKAIEAQVQCVVDTFVYPYGTYNRTVKGSVGRHFRLACSTTLGFVGPNSDPLALERVDMLSFAKTPSGGQVVDRSAPIMPRSNRSGRRSPCLHGVDPRDNSTASRQIPFPIRSPASRWPLGRTGDTARAAEATPLPSAWQMPAGFPGRGRASASRSGTRPRPFDPSVSPRQFGQSAGPQAG